MRWFALVTANPDAVQLTMPARLPSGSRQKPALVLRSDVANVYGNPLDEHLFSHHPNAIEANCPCAAAFPGNSCSCRAAGDPGGEHPLDHGTAGRGHRTPCR